MKHWKITSATNLRRFRFGWWFMIKIGLSTNIQGVP